MSKVGLDFGCGPGDGGGGGQVDREGKRMGGGRMVNMGDVWDEASFFVF